MPRLTKIYTRKGDEGTTSLGSGERVEKDSPRVAAFGAVDELNATLGVALAHGLEGRLKQVLTEIQNELFHVGAELSFRPQEGEKIDLPRIEERNVKRLEQEIDELGALVGPLENFILPGGSLGAANLHFSRTVCRRAERQVVALAGHETVAGEVLRYLNRLSDALFMMARYQNYVEGVAEPLWDTHA